MKSYALLLLAAVAAPAPAWAAAAATPAPTPEAAAAPVAESVVTAPKAAPHSGVFAVGLGYPDIRLRYDFRPDWALEAKASFGEGLQIYSGRLSRSVADLGPLKALVGTEGGWIKFDGLETVSGNGGYGQVFLGLELPFASRLKLEVDGGPVWAQLWAEGETESGSDLAFDAALYIYF